MRKIVQRHDWLGAKEDSKIIMHRPRNVINSRVCKRTRVTRLLWLRIMTRIMVAQAIVSLRLWFRFVTTWNYRILLNSVQFTKRWFQWCFCSSSASLSWLCNTSRVVNLLSFSVPWNRWTSPLQSTVTTTMQKAATIGSLSSARLECLACTPAIRSPVICTTQTSKSAR